MDGLSLVLDVAAALLVCAGVAKLLDPQPTSTALSGFGRAAPLGLTRLIGAVEITLGAAALLTASTAAAVLVALAYFLFAAFVIAARQRDLASCGCFGTTGGRPSVAHVAANVVLAIGSAGAAIAGVVPVRDQPAAIVVIPLAVVGYALLTKAGPRAPRSSGLATSISDVDLTTGRTVLVFLTTTCLACHDIWAALGREPLGPDVQAVAVVKQSEPADRVAELAPTGLRVVRDSSVWTQYRVDVAPAVVIVEHGQVIRSAVAQTWPDVVGLARAG